MDVVSELMIHGANIEAKDNVNISTLFVSTSLVLASSPFFSFFFVCCFFCRNFFLSFSSEVEAVKANATKRKGRGFGGESRASLSSLHFLYLYIPVFFVFLLLLLNVYLFVKRLCSS